MKKIQTKTIKCIGFTNKNGHTIYLPETTTIEDLARMGIKINMQPMNVPIKENDYVHPPKNK